MISSGNIQKLGQLLDSTIKHGRVTLQEIKENANYWDVDAEWIVDTLININFFIQIDDYYLPNPEKKNIQNSNSTNISKIALREILRNEYMINKDKMHWLPLLNKGKQKAKRYIDIDILACLEEYGLWDIGNIEDLEEVLLSIDNNLYNSDKKLAIGKIGEYLSYQFESKRVSQKPFWEAHYGNSSSPYDIKSVISDKKNEELYIEVKTSTANRLIISKSEYLKLNDNTKSALHIWDLSDVDNIKLVVINDIYQLKKAGLFPNDTTNSNWKSNELNFKFTTCLEIQSIPFSNLDIVTEFDFPIEDIKDLISKELA
jgi:hypothetical protein